MKYVLMNQAYISLLLFNIYDFKSIYNYIHIVMDNY